MAVYLLRYDDFAGDPNTRHGFARYYVGYASDHNLPCRIHQHRRGEWMELDIPDREPPALPRWFFEQGIGFTVARIWWGAGKDFERRLKRGGHYKRHDPHHPVGRARIQRGTHTRPRADELTPQTKDR